MDPKDFILSHANQRIYDPVKAHDYYIRNRKLKGRRPAMAKLSTHNVRKAGKLTGDLAKEDTRNKVDNQGHLLPQFRGTTITEQRQAQVKQRVTALKGKLKILHTILNKLVAEATAASAASPKKTSKSGTTKSQSAGTKRKALTGAQKSDKAKKAKATYQKLHPKSVQAQKDKERQQKIDQVKQQIEQVQMQLKETLARARTIATQSQPAKTKPPNLRKGIQNGS